MTAPRSVDEARALHPAIAFSVYAYPGELVTLEIVDDGKSYVWRGASERACWEAAFPAPELELVTIPVQPPAGPLRDELNVATPSAPQPIGLFD